ncbi:GNAT family N-acetyltransferase [Pontibacter sp. SGAir0037]|uniref:GNAT family N-acetyltransferase n=1 Tax=Pontibacter sp. SGAir0037 TaxID=2571030 RepID=UPI0010CD066C|nr:GNAT family N-acetyltransferase [Pontibacter sp. SGAir0037]QCR25149.1 GNAT family N-acetyltransferase [Pontibacter sp. SGAir0037]
MVEIVRYSAEHKLAWDGFVRESKNGTFLLLRDYMEYHADRFADHSLLFYRKGKLVALFPANEQEQEVHSHSGLSYGGVISDSRMKADVMLALFTELIAYYKALGFYSIFYKAIPHLYHQLPAEEDLYALFRNKALLYRRDITSVIEPGAAKTAYGRKRKWHILKANRKNLLLVQSDNFRRFMGIEQKVLEAKYQIKPVHTADEMVYLASMFPENIKLFAAYEQEEMLAGIVIYETATVAHCQYMAATTRGRVVSAMDALVDYLLKQVYPHKKYFSFGISTEQQGHYLNKGLIQNKESYGARALVHDFYELKL